MFPTLPSTIDNLTALGVIDFDAESYIKGATPRYVGAPHHGLPFETPLPHYEVPKHLSAGIKPYQQAHHDEFKSHSTATPSWKKSLTAGLVAGLGAFAIYKIRPQMFKSITAKFKDINFKNITEKVTDLVKKPIELIKKQFKKAI